MSRAKLLHNVPGEVVVIDLPLSALSAFNHEISVKSILRDIAPAKPRPAAPQQQQQGSKNSGENNENVGKSHLHQLGNGMNTFAKFIEEMERKYTGQHLSNVGSSSDEDEDDGGEEDGMILDGDSVDSSMEGEDGKGDAASASAGVEGKKKRRNRDFYDYDDGDGFIDDGEVEEEIHQLITGKNKKTKHSGFFQSDGQDELETETPAVVPTRPTPKTGAAGAASSSFKGSSVTFAPSPPGSAEKKKTPWNPTPNALLALQTFKSSVRVLSFYPLRRNDPFPPELEKPLLQLDALIRKEQGDTALARTTGYHEAVAAALGGEVPIARVAIFLKRLQLKVESDKHKKLLLAAIQELKDTLTSKVSVCAAPTTTPGEDGAAAAAGDSPRKGAAAAAAAEGDDEKVAYTHQVRWDVVTRTLLVSIEQHVENWLLGENKLRDTPDLGPKEPPLEKAQELTGIFNHVRDTAFSHLGAGALVKGGDVATMKRRLSEEKQRLKKKEKEAAEQQAKRSWGSEALGLDQLSSSSSSSSAPTSSSLAAAAAAVGTPFAFGPQSPSSKKAVSSKGQKKGTSPAKPKLSFVLPPPSGATSAPADGQPLTTKKRPAAPKKTGPAFGSTYARMCPFDAADFLEETAPSSLEAGAVPASVIFVAPKPKQPARQKQPQPQQYEEEEKEEEEEEEEEVVEEKEGQAVAVPSENEQVYEMNELEDEDEKEEEEKKQNEEEQEQEHEDNLNDMFSGGTAVGTPTPPQLEEE